mmetsp:Transcript_46163/g.128673  ORF Transcript_46163/g.128673 Transcript_46163/m.128673 type:complete len:117 (+) Transcript_46163:532-882(+)
MESNKESIHHITTRHESGAGYAADGYARATNDMAAVCVITGVGLTNTITPMAVALADSVPMLVISSQVPSFWSGDRSSRQYSHFVPNIGEETPKSPTPCGPRLSPSRLRFISLSLS